MKRGRSAGSQEAATDISNTAGETSIWDLKIEAAKRSHSAIST